MRKSIFAGAITVLVIGVMAAGEAGAADRASGGLGRRTIASSSVSEAADWRQGLEAWLARLQGSFTVRLDIPEKTVCTALAAGMQRCTTARAVAYVSAGTCRGTGEESGLQCTFEQLRYETPGNAAGDVGAPAPLLSNQLPSRLQFGIDPVARKISVTITDPNRSSYNAIGAPVGNDLNFKEKCVRDNARVSGPCSWSFSIHVSRDGHRIRMTRSRYTGTELNTLSGLGDPHAFELVRVEQPALPQSP
jgi:hypothetical protein